MVKADNAVVICLLWSSNDAIECGPCESCNERQYPSVADSKSGIEVQTIKSARRSSKTVREVYEKECVKKAKVEK